MPETQNIEYQQNNNLEKIEYAQYVRKTYN